MSAPASSSTISNMKPHQDIADINVSARIDYNLRFTQQVVLVVGEQASSYSQAARDYLVSLSNQDNHGTNTAFVSASPKLNDIQIRCRVVEQLFSNTLFDPEQSLALSVPRLAQMQSEAITVIVEHGQSLSLQIKYELCQLVLAGKKLGKTINVVLFGTFEAGTEVASNKNLFQKKLSVIDAETGQLYNFEHPKLAANIVIPKIARWHKITLLSTVICLMMLCIGMFVYISQVGDIDSANMAEPSFSISEVLTDSTETMNQKNAFTANASDTKHNLTGNNEHPKSDNIASVTDINSVLLNKNVTSQLKQTANTAEVLSALNVTFSDALNAEDKVIVDKSLTASSRAKPVEVLERVKEEGVSNEFSRPNYYQQVIKQNSSAYVIQLGGFSDEIRLKDFLDTFPHLELYQYNKLLTNNKFTVVTSKHYANEFEARNAMRSLPQALLDRQPWLKPISAVISEINTFNSHFKLQSAP